VRKRAIRFNVLANFVSISDRHEHIRQHQIRAYIRNLSHRRFAIAHGDDVDALIFQGKPHHLLDVAVIVRDQNPSHRTSSNDTLPAWATLSTRPYEMALPMYWSIRWTARQSQRGECVSEVNTSVFGTFLRQSAPKTQGVRPFGPHPWDFS
jgi:hypothetical protein